jgi:hypothetical protein
MWDPFFTSSNKKTENKKMIIVFVDRIDEIGRNTFIYS